MAKLILYQAKSPYAGDITKNCALTGKEVDNNFLNLKGEDIETIYLDEETKKLTFTRFKNGLKNCNGETIDAKIEVDLTELEYVVGYEYDHGSIKVLYSNGKTAVMPIEAFGMMVATDSTIDGNGSKGNPLSLGQALRTGQYKPVLGIIDTLNGEKLPEDKADGDGYVTKELKSKFGLFYNSDEALLLDKILQDDNSEWRVPQKKDWDRLLNYLEDCDRYKNHSLRSENDLDARGMKLGYIAGAKSKSADTYWNSGGFANGDVLRVYPTGSYRAFDTNTYSGFGDFAQFWSTTPGDVSCRNFYSKRFDDLAGTVMQIEEMPSTKLTIRLVKDFLGDNYHKFEEIHGRMYETKLFSSGDEDCNQVWTMVSVDIQDIERGLIPTPMPEEASSITATVAYYINRWNGKEWDKVEMVEGDCVVVTNPEDCEDMVEYRLQCGELRDVIGDIEDKISDLASASTATIEALEGLLERVEILEERVDVLSAATQDIVDKIGKPSDVPGKAAVEYTDADFDEGRITVFGFINASNDYGYNLDDE